MLNFKDILENCTVAQFNACNAPTQFALEICWSGDVEYISDVLAKLDTSTKSGKLAAGLLNAELELRGA